MTDDGLKGAMSLISVLFEISGVAVIVVGFFWAAYRVIRRRREHTGLSAYQSAKATFGRSILLGLEVLVAADLIRTIAVDPTLQNLYVLGLLVLIRTFLSFSLDVELEGAWPWDKWRAGAAERVSGDRAS